jgi:hypothetical protein
MMVMRVMYFPIESAEQVEQHTADNRKALGAPEYE